MTQALVMAQSTKADSLQSVVQKTKIDTTRINTLNLLANELQKYDIQKSERTALEALAQSEKTNYKKGKGDALLALSKIERGRGNHLSSLNKVVEALKLFENLKDVKGKAKAYFEIGYIYKETRNYEKSISNFTKSMELFKSIDNNKNVAQCQMVMGHVNADKASIAKDTVYLGKTLKLYNKALEYFEKTNDKERICVSYLNIANSYLGRNNLTPSAHYLEKSIYYSNLSLKLSRDILKNDRSTSINLLNIGEAYFNGKKYQSALQYFLMAYPMAVKTGDIDIKMSTLNFLIRTYKETKDFEKANAWSDEYLKAAKSSHFIGYLKSYYLMRSEINILQKEYEKAYQNRILYETFSDSLLNEEKAKAFIEYQIAYESETKDKEIALLSKNQELQQTHIKQQQTIRNVLATAVGLILLLLLLLYNRFRSNIKNSRIIKQKNKKLEKLSIVARETANGVFITDKDGNAEWFNEGFSKLFGWESIEEYVLKRGKNISEVSGKDNIKEVIEQSILERKSIIYDALNPTKKGDKIWVQTTLTPIFDELGNIKNLVFVEADISELKNSEARYAAVNKELEAFSYSVSHDLRAPLRAINGYSQILKDDYQKNIDPEGMKIIEAILKNSGKMGELIDDLLTFSRLGRTEMNTSILEMKQLVQNVLDEQIQTENSNIEVLLKELHPIKGSPSLLTQVWVNLISNALKFSKNKTKIYIEIGSYSKEDDVVYYIKDNGAGFDMHYYHKLFGVFQRLHSQEEFEGTGIGLAIIQRIIQRHNGTVWAESKLNEGSCFYFSLPNTT